MKAVAQRIGNSKNESILIDGEVFLKSVAIGRWDYIVVIDVEDEYFYAGGERFIGKSGSLQAAEKWVPFPMVRSIELHGHLSPESLKERRAEIAKFKDMGRGSMGRARRNRFGGGHPVYSVPFNFSRRVIKIEREYSK